MSGPNRLGLSYKDIFSFFSLSPSFCRKKLDRVKEFINNLNINKNKLKLIKSPRENFLPVQCVLDVFGCLLPGQVD